MTTAALAAAFTASANTDNPDPFPRSATPFRHLGRMARACRLDVCEMGDEDGCRNTPAYWLTAPASYTIPLMVCEAHAADEVRYFGTPMPEAR